MLAEPHRNRRERRLLETPQEMACFAHRLPARLVLDPWREGLRAPIERPDLGRESGRSEGASESCLEGPALEGALLAALASTATFGLAGAALATAAATTASSATLIAVEAARSTGVAAA